MKVVKALILLAAVLSLSVMAHAKDEKPNQDVWYGIYYDQTKIGYKHTTITADKYEGKDVLRREDAIVLKGRIPQSRTESNITRTLITDLKFNPIYESIRTEIRYPDIDSKAITDLFEMKYGKDSWLIIITKTDGQVQQTPVNVDDGTKAIARTSCQYDFGKREISLGDSVVMGHSYLCDVSISDRGFDAGFHSGRTTLKVLKSDQIRNDEKDYNTLFVTETSKNGDVKRWQLKTGEIIKEEVPKNHITFILESKEKATSIEKGDAPDLVKLMKS